VIKSEIDRLDRLVRDFLAFSKPRPMEPLPVDVSELITAVADLIRPEATAAQVSVTVDVPSGTLAVKGDPERLRQVLLNLTRNALEAMNERGGRLQLRARNRDDADGAPLRGTEAAADGGGGDGERGSLFNQAVELEVEDDGPGFPEELPIFDAFFTTKEQGTGLGLALVHRIVADHGGTIRVTSRPGRTCFTLRLPAGV
jgi:signal transduction histidine kinase